MGFDDFSMKGELLSMISLKGIFSQKVKACNNQIKLPLFKLVSITTDGAPAQFLIARNSKFDDQVCAAKGALHLSSPLLVQIC